MKTNPQHSRMNSSKENVQDNKQTNNPSHSRSSTIGRLETNIDKINELVGEGTSELQQLEQYVIGSSEQLSTQLEFLLE